jgi:hypothetical protein
MPGLGPPAAAERAAFGARRRAAHAVGRLERLAVAHRREARHAQVARTAAEGVGMPGPAAAAAFDRRGAGSAALAGGPWPQPGKADKNAGFGWRAPALKVAAP